jgi:MerR family transcriptional regulator, light-induced transcriptional regulator
VTDRSPVPNPAGSVREILDACLTFDPTRVREELDLAVEALGVGGCFDEVLFPALREIGALWQSGDLELEAERLTSETVRGWLEELALNAPEATDEAPLILACGPADRHSIGLEALGVLLRNEHRRCRVLGTRTPVGALVTAVHANRPSAVVIASHLPANRESATLSLRAVAALGPEVFYAGNAFASARQRQDVPGTHLDTTLRGACEIILGAHG